MPEPTESIPKRRRYPRTADWYRSRKREVPIRFAPTHCGNYKLSENERWLIAQYALSTTPPFDEHAVTTSSSRYGEIRELGLMFRKSFAMPESGEFKAGHLLLLFEWLKRYSTEQIGILRARQKAGE